MKNTLLVVAGTTAAPRTRTVWRRSSAVAIIVAVLVLCAGAAGPASARWSIESASSTVMTSATTLGAGNAPTLAAQGDDIYFVTWAPSALVSGRAATGYTVRTYDPITNGLKGGPAGCLPGGTCPTDAVMSSCVTYVIAGTECWLALVPGSWIVKIVPLYEQWIGPESPASAAVTIAEPSS